MRGWEGSHQSGGRGLGAPLPWAASSARPPSSSSDSGTLLGAARSMGPAGGGRRAAGGQRRGARGAAPGFHAPAEPPQPTLGPGCAVQLSRPGGGRGGGGAAGRAVPSLPGRPPPEARAPWPRGGAGPRPGAGAGTPNLSQVGAEKGGRIRAGDTPTRCRPPPPPRRP